MVMKHDVMDADRNFIVQADTRKIVKETNTKPYLMQYDHNSEALTFEVPIHIENHDMSLCDAIQIHYENTSTGTSSSARKSYRGIHTIKKEEITVNTDTITFSWLVPDSATSYPGTLKIQLKFICYNQEELWLTKEWGASPLPIVGTYIWTNGTDIYYSQGTTSLILEGNMWRQKTWEFMPQNNILDAKYIWTDGTNTYYSIGSTHYILTMRGWETKTWDYPLIFNGEHIWTDGKQTYVSNKTEQYVLVDGSNWRYMSWGGLSSFEAKNVWTDGVKMYYSTGSNHYVLQNSVYWVPTTWIGLTSFEGENIWTDGEDTYYTMNGNSYVLRGSTWEPKTWVGASAISDASCIWTDGKEIYYSNENTKLVLAKTTSRGYTWHTDVYEGIGVKSGLPYTSETLPPSATATLQSLKIVETQGGFRFILDGVSYFVGHVSQGDQGSQGVQIDLTQAINAASSTTAAPSAKAVYTFVTNELKKVPTITPVKTVSSSSTDTDVPSAKAVYTHVSNELKKVPTITPVKTVSSSSTDTDIPSAKAVYTHAANQIKTFQDGVNAVTKSFDNYTSSVNAILESINNGEDS